MADVKINNGKYIFGDDGFEATTGDSSAPEESNALDHDADNAVNTIGKGAKVTEHLDPLIMADDGYFDLPAESTGHATLLIGDAEYLFEFDWDRYNTVNLISGSSSAYLVTGADNDTQFCAFDNTSSVRVKNRLGSAKRVLGEIHYTELPVVPTFQLFAEPSGVDNLDSYLTINGTTVTPTFRYKLGDANATDLSPWGYGETLTRVSVATPPTYNEGSPGLGDNDDSCLFNASDYYKKTSAASQFTTGDLVVEIIWKQSGTAGYIVSTWTTNGLSISTTATTIVMGINDDDGNTYVVSANNLIAGCWYYGVCFINRDEASTNGSQWYINGVSSGTGVDCAGQEKTLTDNDFAMGARPSGTNNASDTVAYIAAWEQADWHQAGASGPAEWAVIAKERFLKFSGMYPQIANGTYLPTTATRAYPAYIDKVEDGYRKLYYVGSEWLRQCHRIDSVGTNVRGYLPETAAENLFTYSEDFSTWDLIEAGTVVVDNAVICPDGRTVAASIAGDSDDEQHGISDDVTLTAATYAYSGFCKPGNKDWIYINNSTVANCDCYFDITNGTVGTSGAGCDGYLEGPFYSGDATPYYRWCIVFTGTATAHTLQISPAQADTDNDFVGDGSTVNTYVWGAQIEADDYMTSPVITSGSALSRLADQLQFVTGDNIGGEDIGRGSVYADVLLSAADRTMGSSSIACLTDGGAVVDRINFYDYNGIAAAYSQASEGNNGSSGTSININDNKKHKYSATWQTDNLVSSVDGVPDATPDIDCAMPNDLDELNIGQNRSSGSQFKGLIQNLRIYDEVTLLG